MCIGVPVAWVMTRTDFPLKKHFRSWFCLPYAIPPYVGAIGWIILANPTSGILNHLAGTPWINIYSFVGLTWVEASFLFPFVLLNALAALDQMDSSLEEAARMSGATPWQVLQDVSLPLLRPAIFNGFVLCLLASAASFGVPALIGSPARIYLMTTQIYSYQRLGSENGMNLSIALSSLLMAFSMILLFISQRWLAPKPFAIVSGKTSRPSVLALGKLRWPLFICFSILLLVIFVLPLGAVLLSALSSVQGSWSINSLGFSNFSRVLFSTEETPRAIGHSLMLGLFVSVFCSLFCFFICYFQTRLRLSSSRWAEIFISIPYSTPGTVVALSLILSFSLGFWGYGPSLYNTLLLMGLAYVIKYLSLSQRIVQDGYQQIHPCLDEAAQVSGASWAERMSGIFFPLLKSSLMAACFLIFMPVVSELTMSILLTGPGLETIGTLIFQLQEYSDVAGGGASVLSVLIVGLVLIMNWSLKKLSQGRYGI